MRAFWERVTSFSLLVRVILFFSVLGTIIEITWLGQDIASKHIIWRLHLGFSILYLSQVILIFLKEKWVCILTALQGILALLTTVDFTFTTALRFLGEIYFALAVPTIEEMKIYQYVFVSLAFTLQMFSAYVLYKEFEEPTEKIEPTEISSI